MSTLVDSFSVIILLGIFCSLLLICFEERDKVVSLKGEFLSYFPRRNC